ncbi:LarC family nickel insertion protein [Granulosicoccus antarcticus]|uniref:Pyridinium-3,5-bisthiocarboxylic acid mononucleotide nickel insertion protein n=1 Tax=Granulosicoccus antarcticus IMCC3135 TaxID=1192854 RepID=A0A2Z2NW28_9GAMM|nr:LarC family nickel insertion protein [Granulosicoccus antarcticus]ASJ71354.1 hypothetical protein IMCC3135_06235 [Granulosicoccus antarcticus IMCC3135]
MSAYAEDARSGHIHMEPVGGVAGDMFVAAMMDLFPEHADACWQDLVDCGVMQHVSVTLESGLSNGLAVKRLQVKLQQKPAKRTGNFKDLRAWLEASALQASVKLRAQAILHLLAEAEAFVHGVDIERVHFHEVADWDSIVDVVAAASMIERSGVASWSCAPLPLGSGLVQTEHGKLPIPAPATAWLLRELPVWDDGEPGERVTPTGAAIVRHVLSTANDQQPLQSQARPPIGTLVSIGCGAGQRDLQQRPNVVRCLLISTEKANAPSLSVQDLPLAELGAGQLIDEIMQLSFDIDDMTPEELSVSLEYLRQESGVLDASFQLGMGKKGRAMFAVTILCRIADEPAVSDRCLEETTTLGMRVQKLQRRTLQRQHHTVSGTQNKAGIKTARRPDGVVTAKVESDDLVPTRGLQARRRLAQELRAPFES